MSLRPQSTNVAALSPVPGWTVTYSQALGMDSTGWSGFNMRQHLAASLLSTSGSKVRLTLEAAAGTSGLSIDGMYIGHQAGAGDVFDFDGGQAQVTVGASASWTIAQGGTQLTDEITFALDETKALLIAVHFNATSTLRGANSVSGATNHFKSAANETATSNVSAYSNSTSALRLINKIEVLP